MVAKNPEGVCDLTHGIAYANTTDVGVWKIYKTQRRGDNETWQKKLHGPAQIQRLVTHPASDSISGPLSLENRGCPMIRPAR